MGDQKFPQKDVRNPGVGQGLALAIVKEAKKVLETLEENPDYEPFKYHPLPFSTLAHTALSRELIDRWLKEPDNVRRAAEHVGRTVSDDTSSLLGSWSVIRTRELSQPGKIKKGLGYFPPNTPQEGPDSHCVAVLVSLDGEPLMEGIRLEQGEDICFDGRTPVTFSGKAGALAILFTLKM